ncbi:MAG: DUF3108 domain-containing protein [Thermoanaerobaculia bacterium]|nr:DUF3108 domain-containing protein [Thermoanaerobaculia bacterium]
MKSLRHDFLFLVFLLGTAPLQAQAPAAPPVFVEETLKFTMTIMGITGGELTLSARHAELDGKPVYKFELSAISNEMLSKIFLVRDYIASWVDPQTFRSLRYEKHTVEGKRVRDRRIDFFYGEGVARRRDDGKVIPITDPTFDELSSVYYIRRLDLSATTPVSINVLSKKVVSVRVDVQARETVTTPAGTFRTIRVEPKSTESGLIGKGKNLVLWVTDDERKMPVQIRSKLKVGTLIGKLRAVEKSGPAAASF